eukprot:2049564-Rhodomonas_salina.2
MVLEGKSQYPPRTHVRHDPNEGAERGFDDRGGLPSDPKPQSWRGPEIFCTHEHVAPTSAKVDPFSMNFRVGAGRVTQWAGTRVGEVAEAGRPASP